MNYRKKPATATSLLAATATRLLANHETLPPIMKLISRVAKI